MTMLGIAFASTTLLASEPEGARLPLWPTFTNHVQGWWRNDFPGRVDCASWQKAKLLGDLLERRSAALSRAGHRELL
jgi:hypothetical protein